MSYCTVDDLLLRYGVDNLTTWAAVDGNNQDALIPTRWQNGIDWATGQINSLLMRGGYSVPLVFMDDYARSMVNEWATALAVWRIYTARGLLDKDAQGGKMEDGRAKAIAEIMKVRAGSIQFNCARKWGDNPTCPTVV